ncbi:hypothetical protein [Fimbriiglobus ruber]|uniref:Phosphopantothenate--cysteine ligase n=1 Tax=Fimbriiglobus ruber TaxID=1908690 RepID=A0A225DIX1_9BACT|nr:hypothetical protein [Fimbriiglobus ruber]OWK36325.1 phosphopantothenate--cysteine ligase [Fimbriiglobus ruber]
MTVVPYQTFDDLAGLIQKEIKTGGYDVAFHSAAVSDYLSAGVYAPEPGTFFNARTKYWERRGNARRWPNTAAARSAAASRNSGFAWFAPPN